MAFRDNPEKQRQAMVDMLIKKFGYQEQVFRRGIKKNKLPYPPVVFDLNAGECEDVIALRRYLGGDAQIYAIDINQPRQPFAPAALHFAHGFVQEDINNIEQCVAKAGGVYPNLIVSRAPRVVENVYSDGRVTMNTWWGDTLVRWAQGMQGPGQMFVTALTQLERDFIVSRFNAYGMKGTSLEMNYTPTAVQQMHQFEGGLHADIPPEYAFQSRAFGSQQMLMKPDGYTFLYEQ